MPGDNALKGLVGVMGFFNLLGCLFALRRDYYVALASLEFSM